jgi:hypothetical protein
MLFCCFLLQIKEFQANDIIRSLFTKISLIYNMISPVLAEEHHDILYNTLGTVQFYIVVRILC